MSDLIVKFEGGDAKAHRVDAYEGSTSLSGLSSALQRIAHYAATGIIRKRAPYSRGIRFFLNVPQQGTISFPYDLAILGGTFIASNIGGGMVSSALWDLVKVTIGSAIGSSKTPSTQFTQQLDKQRSGDLEALVDAIEPSIKLAHTAVSSSAQTIYIITGGNNTILNQLTPSTKAYVETNLRGSTEAIDVFVGALNVNQRTGRVFYGGWGKTVPFHIATQATPRTLPALSWGLDGYANKSGRAVRVHYEPIRAADERVKKIIIHDAERLDDAT